MTDNTLLPDVNALGEFIWHLFKNGGWPEGSYISLRGFHELEDTKPAIKSVKLNGDIEKTLNTVIEQAAYFAADMARKEEPFNFAPPVCAFNNRNGYSAGKADVSCGVAISVDVDESVDDALAILTPILGQPTIVTHSGGMTQDGRPKGHIHWRLKTPAVGQESLNTLTDARELAAMLTGSDTTNVPISHPLRWAGSIHRKKDPKVSSIAMLNEDVEVDLGEAFKALKSAANAKGITLKKPDVKGTTTTADSIDNSGSAYPFYVDEVLLLLKQEGMLVDEKPSKGFFTIQCPWGHAHTTGGTTAGYSPVGYGEDDYQKTRGFKCMHEHCKNRTYKDLAKHLAEVTFEEIPLNAPLAEALDRFIHVGIGSKVYDRTIKGDNGRWYGLDDFKSFHNEQLVFRHVRYRTPKKAGEDGFKFITSKRKLGLAWHDAANRVKATDTCYHPKGELLVKSEVDDAVLLNSYVEPHHPKVADRSMPRVFQEHIDFVIPNKVDRENFLDWLAFRLQNPDRRAYAVLMVTEAYGVGRSTIGHIVTALVGGAAKNQDFDKIMGEGSQGQYNEYLYESQIVIGNEIKQSKQGDFAHDSAVYEKLKNLVDDSEAAMWIYFKYGRTLYTRVYAMFLLFSNHLNALQLPANDRRFHIIENASEPRPTEERYKYAEVDRFKRDEMGIAQLYWHLMERDISKFNPNEPPMTEAKDRMVRMSLTSMDSLVEEIKGQLVSEIVTKAQLVSIASGIARRLNIDGGRATGVANKLYERLPRLDPKSDSDEIRYRVTVKDENGMSKVVQRKVSVRIAVLGSDAKSKALIDSWRTLFGTRGGHQKLGEAQTKNDVGRRVG